jgi:hypothetical protein
MEIGKTERRTNRKIRKNSSPMVSSSQKVPPLS